MPRYAVGAAQPAAQPAQPAVQPAPPPLVLALPSPPGLTFDTVVVQPEGHSIGVTLPKFMLPDGRNASQPIVTYVPQRFLEIILFQRYDGGSSGAVHKIIQLAGLGATAWTINAKAVRDNELSQAHADFMLNQYKQLLPTSNDPLLANRTRNIVLLPIAAAAAVCRGRGRSPATTAFLRACAPNDLPRSWEVQEQAEAHQARGEHDLLLNDQLVEAEDADADVSFEAELRAGGFSSFTQKIDDEKSHDYAIKAGQIGAKLKREGDMYTAFRVSPLEARRASTAVADKTAKADLQNYYRFLGFLKLKSKLPLNVHYSLDLLTHASASQWVADWVEFMKEERALAFSSMGNYINSLFGIASYVWDSEDFEVSDAVADAPHTVLDALLNTRSQCESLAKEAGLYADKRGGWSALSASPQTMRPELITHLTRCVGGLAQ